MAFKRFSLALLVCLAVAACKSSEERAQEHYENGLKLVAEGDLDRALVEFRNTLKLEVNNLDARREMARIKYERGNIRGAYRDYLRIVEQKSDDLEGRKILSKLAFTTRNWDEFKRHSNAAIELAPDDIEIRAIALGSSYRDAVIDESETERSAILVNAETLSEDLPDNEILRQILIDGYVAEQKYGKALVELDKAIAAKPDELQLYNAKLELLARLGDFPEVEATLRQMVALFPEDENVRATLLRFLMSRNQTDKAEEFLRETIASSTDEDRGGNVASLVQFLLRTKGFEAGLAEVEAQIAAAPEADVLRSLRAGILFDQGNRDEGISELEALLAEEDSSLTKAESQNAKVALARMLIATSNEVGARKLVEEILVTDPNAVGALKMQAGWLIQDDKTEEAINALRAALDQAPQDAQAMTLMAEAYQRTGNKDLMLQFLSLAVEASNKAPAESLRYAQILVQDEKFLQAESTLIDALRITPGNLQILSALGQVYLRLDDMPRAQQVVATLQDMDAPEAKQAADAINVEIVARQGGSTEALSFLENLASEDGDNANRAKLAVLNTRLRNGETEAALDYAQSLVDEAPDHAGFRVALALTHATAGQYDEAESELGTVLDRFPQSVPLWLQLVRIHVAQNDLEAARGTLDTALTTLPGAPDLLWAKASFAQRDGDIDGAIAIYEDLYETNSGSFVVANNLASLLTTYRKDPESLARAEVIARRLQNSDLPAFQDTYGWILHLNGESEKALPYMESAARGLPDDMTVQKHLGMVYAALGRRDDALEQLRKAIDVGGPLGDATLIEEMRTKIQELENAN